MGTGPDIPRLILEGPEADTDVLDRQLVRRAQSGETAAFEALVRRHERRIFTFAYRMVGERTEAEDMAQEVFLKAYRGLHGFRGASRFSTWLHAIAAHHCASYLSARKRRRERETPPPNVAGRCDGNAAASWDGMRDAAPGPDAALEGRDLRQRLETALAELSTEHRLVVVLRDVQGLSYEEIAATLAIEMGTVRSRLHRARMALRAALAPHVAEEPAS
jgi:RNA polymerase sigma-70 factor, ECF subfamily